MSAREQIEKVLAGASGGVAAQDILAAVDEAGLALVELPVVHVRPWADADPEVDGAVTEYAVEGEADVTGYGDQPTRLYRDGSDAPIERVEREALGVLAVLAAMRADGIGVSS